jgi:hypothetical protein
VLFSLAVYGFRVATAGGTAIGNQQSAASHPGG